MKVAKWGNSLAIRIPAAVAEVLDLKVGDEIDVRVAGEGSLDLRKKPDAAALLKRLRKYRGRMPADWKFDRFEANER
jgi:antitoxin MazE